MSELRPKISIIGCGNVGTRYAYALTIKGLARHLVMVDIAKNRVEGDVMDLSHGSPYISPVKITPGEMSDIRDSDLVVITAGKGQKPGQSRLDLIKDNVGLFKTLIPEIVKLAPRAIYLVVSNPVDILSYAAYKISGKPANEVIGSGTVLDTARFRYLLGKHFSVDTRNVHAYILGEHGDSEFPVWSTAMIGGILIDDFCPMCGMNLTNAENKELDKIFQEVRDSAYKIIELKGETSYGIGLAMVRITQAILSDENTILPVSSLLNDYFGESGIYLSVPSLVNRSGIKQTLKIELNETEKKKFKESANVMKNIIHEIGLE